MCRKYVICLEILHAEEQLYNFHELGQKSYTRNALAVTKALNSERTDFNCKDGQQLRNLLQHCLIIFPLTSIYLPS